MLETISFLFYIYINYLTLLLSSIFNFVNESYLFSLFLVFLTSLKRSNTKKKRKENNLLKTKDMHVIVSHHLK
jgi:hypothetical protein